MTRHAFGLDLRLYLVTDPDLVSGRRIADVVAAAVRGGVTLVQLRDKSASSEQLEQTAHELLTVLEPAGVPLVVNDDVAVAAAVGAAGVHVGTSDAPPAKARDDLGPAAVVGWSVESLDQLDDPQLGACTYLAASPVWGTPTKTDAAAPLGVDRLREMTRLTRLPVVAIGGVDAGRAAEAVTAGAAGVAVVSAILAHSDPEQAARRLRAAVDEALARRKGARR